jgi:hypothetical protein
MCLYQASISVEMSHVYSLVTYQQHISNSVAGSQGLLWHWVIMTLVACIHHACQSQASIQDTPHFLVLLSLRPPIRRASGGSASVVVYLGITVVPLALSSLPYSPSIADTL